MQIDTDKLVRKFEENPTAFMAATSALLMSVSQVIKAVGSSRGSHAFARQVNHRIRMDSRRK